MGLTIDLSNRCALITGATGQLGRVMVRTLANILNKRIAIVPGGMRLKKKTWR